MLGLHVKRSLLKIPQVLRQFKVLIIYQQHNTFTVYCEETSTCLVSLFDQPSFGSKRLMKTLCKKRKMCVALTMIGEEEDFHDELEADADSSHGKNEMQMKFSYQVAWVMVKPSRSGHIVKINCGGKSKKYLSRNGGIQHSRYKMVHHQNMNIVLVEIARYQKS